MSTFSIPSSHSLHFLEKKIPFFWLADEADDDSDTAAYRRDKGRDKEQDDESDATPVHRSTRPLIPVPHMTTIREHDELRADFSRPKEYIRFKGTSARSIRRSYLTSFH